MSRPALSSFGSQLCEWAAIEEARRSEQREIAEMESYLKPRSAKIAEFSAMYHASPFYKGPVDPQIPSERECDKDSEQHPELQSTSQNIPAPKKEKKRRLRRSRKKESKFDGNLKARLEGCPLYAQRVAFIESVFREGLDSQKKIKYAELFLASPRIAEFKEEMKAKGITPEALMRVFNSRDLTTEEQTERKKNGKPFSTKYSRQYQELLLALRI